MEWKSTMLEWLRNLVPFLGGISAVVFTDYLRHKWRRAEKYQDLFIEKRFDACTRLWSMIVELLRNIDPVRLGAKTLLWSPTEEEASERPAEEVAQADRVAGNLAQLTRFVAENQMLLGPNILRAWYVYYAALGQLQIALNAETERHAVVMVALQNLLHPFSDAVAKAIVVELRDARPKFLLSAERESLMGAGLEEGDRLLAEAKDRLSGGGKADAEKV